MRSPSRVGGERGIAAHGERWRAEWREAKYMALDKYPHSLEAQQACKVITAELQAAEERVRRRKRKDQINVKLLSP